MILLCSDNETVYASPAFVKRCTLLKDQQQDLGESDAQIPLPFKTKSVIRFMKITAPILHDDEKWLLQPANYTLSEYEQEFLNQRLMTRNSYDLLRELFILANFLGCELFTFKFAKGFSSVFKSITGSEYQQLILKIREAAAANPKKRTFDQVE